MKRLLYILSVFALTACVAVRESGFGDSAQRDWHIFRGTPSLSGYTECYLPASPKLLWSTTTHTRTVASPIVFDGVVFMLNRKGELRGYTLDGDSCAYYNFKTAVEASFIASDTMLYVGRIDGYVSALSIKGLPLDGEASVEKLHLSLSPVWQYETMGQISGSPNLVGDNLLVGSYDNSMYTFQAKTGMKTGQFETGYYINGTAAVWHRYMIFGGCDAWVRVVDVGTGEMTDSLQLDSYVPASPAVLDFWRQGKSSVACACDYNGNVYEMTLDGGRIPSHRKLYAAPKGEDDQNGGVMSMPALTQRDVIVLSGERYISCIDRSSGQVRWRKMLRGTAGECSPLVAQDKVLVCTKDGHVSILGVEDGSELWHYETGEQIIASPAIIGDRFFIQTSRGTLLCFS